MAAQIIPGSRLVEETDFNSDQDRKFDSFPIQTKETEQTATLPQEFNIPHTYARSLPIEICPNDSPIANELCKLAARILESDLNVCKTHACENSNCLFEKYFQEIDILKILITDPSIASYQSASLEEEIASIICESINDLDQKEAQSITKDVLLNLKIYMYLSPIQNKYRLLPKVEEVALQDALRTALSSIELNSNDLIIECAAIIQTCFDRHTKSLFPLENLPKPHSSNIFLLLQIAKVYFAGLTKEPQRAQVESDFTIPYALSKSSEGYLPKLEEILTSKNSSFSYPPILRGYVLRVLSGIESTRIKEIYLEIRKLGYIKQYNLIKSLINDLPEPEDTKNLEEYKKVERRIHRLTQFDGTSEDAITIIRGLWIKLLTLVENPEAPARVLSDYKIKELEAIIHDEFRSQNNPEIVFEMSNISEIFYLPDESTSKFVCERCTSLMHHYSEILERILTETKIQGPDSIHPNFSYFKPTSNQKLPLQVTELLKVRIAYQNKWPSIDELISYVESQQLNDSMFYQYLLARKNYQDAHQKEPSIFELITFIEETMGSDSSLLEYVNGSDPSDFNQEKQLLLLTSTEQNDIREYRQMLPFKEIRRIQERIKKGEMVTKAGSRIYNPGLTEVMAYVSIKRGKTSNLYKYLQILETCQKHTVKINGRRVKNPNAQQVILIATNFFEEDLCFLSWIKGDPSQDIDLEITMLYGAKLNDPAIFAAWFPDETNTTTIVQTVFALPDEEELQLTDSPPKARLPPSSIRPQANGPSTFDGIDSQFFTPKTPPASASSATDPSSNNQTTPTSARATRLDQFIKGTRDLAMAAVDVMGALANRNGD